MQLFLLTYPKILSVNRAKKNKLSGEFHVVFILNSKETAEDTKKILQMLAISQSFCFIPQRNMTVLLQTKTNAKLERVFVTRTRSAPTLPEVTYVAASEVLRVMVELA